MALNRKTFKKAAGDAPSNLPSGYFNTVLYTGNGSTQRVGGYINRAAVFNGSSSYIDLGNNESNNKSLISVSCWFRTSSTSTAIIWNNGGNDSSSTGLALKSLASGVLYFQANTSGTSVTDTGTTTINDGNWHHVVVNYDNGDFNVYLDGNSTAELTGTSSAFTTTANQNFIIGRLSRVSVDYFNGAIDQFRIFNRELTTSEVTTLKGETFASASKSVTDIFSDSSAIALYQLDGNANDTGGVSGKFGEAAIFNGSSSIIKNTSLGTDYRGQTTLSLSAWFKTSASSGRMTIVSFSATGDGSTDLFLGLDVNTVGFRNINDGANQVQAENISGSSVRDGNWHHAVFTADSNGNKLYVDGNEITVNYDTGSSSSTIVMPSDLNQFNIGGNQDSGGNQWYWDGEIDDVRIYSDVLTSQEVGYIYNNTTASIPTDNLTAYYKLNGDARDEQQLYDGTATNVTYAYNGTATNVTYQDATNFSPDLIWVKRRDSGIGNTNHLLFDSVRGAGKRLISNVSNAESIETDEVTSFNSNGFTVGADPSTNGSGGSLVAWCFNAADTTTTIAANTVGNTIASEVRANTDAGFSIVKWSGSSSQHSVAHGLGVKPSVVLIKSLDNSNNWYWYTDVIDGSMDYLYLDTSGAKADSGRPLFDADVFYWAASGNNIAYCFHSVNEIQKVGFYTGNGSANGTIVETGFEPAFLMIKKTNGTGSWYMYDNKRTTSNPRNVILQANESAAEGGTSYSHLDFLSNGFQLKTTNAEFNGSSDTYIYLAIAADPDITTPTVENSFDVVTWTGNGSSSRSISTDFKPDLIWLKNRTGTANNHFLIDSVRGKGSGTSYLNVYPNVTNAEVNDSGIASIDDNGFTTSSSRYASNDWVAWCWKAGDHNDNLPQINTEGTIDSVVSVNDAAGFSIVSYTGDSQSSATIGHGLSSAPELIITKARNFGAGWPTMVKTSSASFYGLRLNDTGANNTPNGLGFYNNTAPTSTVYSVGGSDEVNDNYNYIAYCFHSVTGYQKVGFYNGSSSTVTITTGFQPRFLIIKRSNGNNDWTMYDTVRSGGTSMDDYLIPNSSSAEYANSSLVVNATSTGFTIASGLWAGMNEAGGEYIYLAIK